MERLYSAKEISAITGISRSVISTLMRSGEIESVRIGIKADGPKAHLRAYESAVDRWLARRMAEAEELRQEVHKPLRMKRTRPGQLPPGAEYGPNGEIRIARRRA